LVSPATTPYYHCISRCVRRALLCGEDPVTGRDYAHRKAWVVARLATRVEVFAIDRVAYVDWNSVRAGVAEIPEAAEPDSLGLRRADYRGLVDWTGRAVRADQPGAIPAAVPPILARLGLDPSGFVRHAAGRSGPRPSVVLGSIARIRQAAEAAGRRFFKGLGLAQRLYAAAA
jgi:hypothetical protein